MSSNTFGIENFSSGPGRLRKSITFTDLVSISALAWVYTLTNSFGPTEVNDARGGGVTFTNGTADNDAIEAQSVSEFVRLNLTGQTYKFLFTQVDLSDATQMDMILALCKRTTTMFTLMSDALFWRKADGETDWRTGHAFNAAAVGDYSEHANTGVDTDPHDLGIKVETDGNTLGEADVTFYLDGVVLDGPYHTTTLPHDEELCIGIGVMNGEAAAKSLSLQSIEIDIPIAA